jgi:sensor histidine kinase regulating citrate/malate metabolism
MTKKRLWAPAAGGSLILPVCALFVWPGKWWTIVLFAVWTAGAAAFAIIMDRRLERRRHARMLDLIQRSAIETLSHHRHDWMNELQILYGYLRLNKPDKAIAVVDRIRGRMEHDSRVSHLGIPKLAAFFLSFRTICDTMRLDVEVEEGFRLPDPEMDQERLTDAVIGLVNVVRLRVLAATDEENVLRLKLRSDERSVVLEINYNGKLAAKESLYGEWERLLEGVGSVTAPGGIQEGDVREVIVSFPSSGQAD